MSGLRPGGTRRTVKAGPSREQVLETLGVLALACLVAGHLARHRPLLAQGFLGSAVALLAVALFADPIARPLAAAWLRLAGVLGAVNSRILLGAIFFLVLTPIAVLARAARGDFLLLRRRAGADRSYWQRRDHAFGREDLGKPW